MLLPCSPCCGDPLYISCVNQNLNSFIFENASTFQGMQFSVDASITGGYPQNVSQFSLPVRNVQVPGTNDAIIERRENIEYTYGSVAGEGVITHFSTNNSGGTISIFWRNSRQSIVNPDLPGYFQYQIKCTDKRTANNPDDFEFLVTLTADFTFISRPASGGAYDTQAVNFVSGSPSVHLGRYLYSGRYVPNWYSPPTNPLLEEVCNRSIYILGVPSLTYEVSMNVPQACSFLTNLLNGDQPVGFTNHPVGDPLPAPLVIPTYAGEQTYVAEPEKRLFATYDFQTGVFSPISSYPNPCPEYVWPDASLPDSAFGVVGQFYATINANLSPAP